MELSYSPAQLLLGFMLAAFAGQLAWRARALRTSGAIAATLVGGLIFGFGGGAWAALLLTFFISSTTLSRLFAKRKQDLEDTFEKGSRRDWGQVTANGGLGAALAVIQAANPNALWPWMAFAGAMAAVNADTWATELGVLSRRQPVLITTRHPVGRGTSGGITIDGLWATLAGAGLVAMIGWVGNGSPGLWASLLPVTLGGAAGSLIDSYLGATVQVMYLDPENHKETEKRPAEDIQPIRGWVWMNNDVVNFISSIGGALVSVAVWQVIG